MADWSLKVVKPENFRGTANILSNGGKNPLTAMFGRDETLNPAVKGYAIYAVFENLSEHKMEAVKAVFGEGESLCYESLTPVIPAAAWYEREIQDMFGIVPQGHPDPRPLVRICSALCRRAILTRAHWCSMIPSLRAFIPCARRWTKLPMYMATAVWI